MPTLTCKCGQPYAVTPEIAGRTVACAKCGRALRVPALGVLVQPTAKPKPTAHRFGWRMALGLATTAVVLSLVCAGSWLAWTLHQPALMVPVVVAKVEPGERETPTREKPPIDERDHVDPPPLVEPAQPTAPAKKVLDPVPVKQAPPPIPVVEPTKPKEVPPLIVKEKPANLLEPLKLVWKLKADETFYQELLVTQKPTFKVQGLPIAMVVQYRIVSRFTVTKRNEDGSLAVEQKIESATLLQADELSKPTIAAALTQMPGTVYKLELSPKMDVTKFTGAGGKAQVNALQLGGGFGFQTSSLLDRDGWKELAQATFFQLDATPKANLRWSEPMTHQWGSLGSWAGQIHYVYAGPQKNLHKITYALQLAYKAPKAGGVGLMQVNGANFQPQEAGGVLLFDAARGKVVSAEERFHVRGVLNANLLGQNTQVEVDEDQHFAIRIHEKLP